MQKSIINIQNLCFTYRVSLILDTINLNIYDKDFLAIIGPNGGGKSTLLKLIIGFLKPNKGKIEISKNQQLAYVPQNININIGFPITALEVVLMGLVHNKQFFSYTKAQKELALEALTKVDMHDFFNKKIEDFSGGQRQRIFIARALISKPSILLLDEPTASIDKIGQKKIYELLKILNKEMTIIVISHDLSVTLEYANRAAYLNQSLIMHENIKAYETKEDHFCEIELLNTLSEVVSEHKCPSC
jgi:zinc transport system ATP-binding protein